jgi:hypothetical protein
MDAEERASMGEWVLKSDFDVRELITVKMKGHP